MESIELLQLLSRLPFIPRAQSALLECLARELEDMSTGKIWLQDARRCSDSNIGSLALMQFNSLFVLVLLISAYVVNYLQSRELMVYLKDFQSTLLLNKKFKPISIEVEAGRASLTYNCLGIYNIHQVKQWITQQTGKYLNF